MNTYKCPLVRLISLQEASPCLLETSRVPVGGTGDFDTRRQDWVPGGESSIWDDKE